MSALLPYLMLGYVGTLIVAGFFQFRNSVISALVFVAISLNAIPFNLFQFEVEQAGVKIEGVIVMLAIGFAIFEKSTGGLRQTLNPYFLLCCVFGFLLCVYLFRTDFYPYGTEKALLYIFKCLFPLVALCLLAPFNRLEMANMAATLIFTAFLIGINSLEHTDVMSQRSGTEMNLGSITIARIIGMGLFLIAVAVRQTSVKSALALPALLFIGAVLAFQFVATGSRGPLASAVVAAGMVFFIRTQNSYLQRIAVPVCCLFFGFFAFSFFQNTELFDSLGFNRLLYLFQDREFGTSEMARIHLQQDAIDGFLITNGIGLGTGGYAILLGVEREWPHNMPLEILCEMGVPGFALFMVILGLTSLRWYKLVRRGPDISVFEDGIVSLWLYYFLNSLVSYDIDGNFGFWITAAFPWLVSIEKAERQKPTKANDANLIELENRAA